MKLSNFLFVKAIISFLFGIGFLVVPTTVGGWYGFAFAPDGVIMARFFAAVLIGVGLILYLCRKADWNLLKHITLSLFIADTIGFITALVGQLAGVMNALGWIIVAIWFLLALGLGYFRFLKPSRV
jgi:hypothetical protein